MTERLSALLHEEAARLDVPVPPAGRALEAGRRVRRRRRFAQGGAVLAVVAAVGVGATLARGGLGADGRDGSDRVADTNPSATTDGQGVPADVGAVFAVGDTVYLQGGNVVAKLDEVAQTLYYTSAGLLVRTNESGNSDGGAPFHFVLVATDGTMTKLSLTLGEVVPSVDPRQPYLAYADASGGDVTVVVVDVRTGEEVTRVPVTGIADWGGWTAPPVSLDGDEVYVSSQTKTVAVNWHTGAVRNPTAVGPNFPDVHGNRTVVSANGRQQVVDATTGAVVFDIPAAGDFPLVRLSPDGRSLLVGNQSNPSADKTELYQLDTGRHATLPGAPWDYGWTPQSQAYRVDADGLSFCKADGQCVASALPTGFSVPGPGHDPSQLLRLGGVVFES